MDNEETATVCVCICVLILVSFLIVTCFATLTRDSTHINLERIHNMVSKCDNNGGLEFIEHDYDVKCKNGATFDYDRLEVSK